MTLDKQTQRILKTGCGAGRFQGFSLLKSDSSLARAVALKQARQSRIFESFGLTWSEFCARHAGISLFRANEMIRSLNKFGADYFRLADICGLASETYAAIANRVDAGHIELDGEKIAIVAENAQRIRKGIAALQRQVRAAEDANTNPVSDMFHRIDRLTKDIYHFQKYRGDDASRVEAARVVRYAARRFRQLRQQLEAIDPAPPAAA